MADEQSFNPGDADFRFLALVMSLATAAWSQLGKIPHPVSQKIEKDLEQAKVSIDFLRMLLEKTQGNLKPKEQELLSNTVADLELNFADEAKKEPVEAAASKGPDIILPAGAGRGPEIIKP
jgi:F0F1-type ATP synthase membrane subunit b/b'